MRFFSSAPVFALLFLSALYQCALGIPVPLEGLEDVKPDDLKNSVYRKAAEDNTVAWKFEKTTGILEKQNVSKGPQPGYQADHVFEAQLGADVINKHWPGLPSNIVGGVKDIMNRSDNMAWLTGSVNSSKGGVNRAVIGGKAPNVRPEVKEYMHETANQGLQIARKIDGYLNSKGYTGNFMEAAERDVLKKAGAI